MRSFLTSTALFALFSQSCLISASTSNVRLPRGDPSANASGSAATNVPELVASTWYAGWHATDFPLSNVSWDKYTHVTYAFGSTADDPSQITLGEGDDTLIHQFVTAAHQNNVKASLAIGGWKGSLYFSTNVGNAENRTKFVKTVTGVAEQFQLDGIDFAWESPNSKGIGCNAVSANDTANFLSFLQELRNTTTGAKLILTAATSIQPFANESGQPSSDVSEFAKVLDYVEIMNFDVWGPWSDSVGPNSPLDDSCESDPKHRQGSAISGVVAWYNAGMPLSQITLGVASYGHAFYVDTSSAYAATPSDVSGIPNGGLSNSDNAKPTLASYPSFDASKTPVGDKWNVDNGTDVCGVTEPSGGTVDFWALVAVGMLTSNGTASDQVSSLFDSCSRTDYVYNSTAQLMVSYDGPDAFAIKGAFIKDASLRGFAMWEAGGDYQDILLDSIRGAVGFNSSLPTVASALESIFGSGQATLSNAAPSPSATAASSSAAPLSLNTSTPSSSATPLAGGGLFN